MKKLLLLSGMIALGAAANLTAMQNRPAAWRALDAHIEDAEDGNWNGVFGVLEQHPNLVNEYMSPDGDSLLKVALSDYNTPVLQRLLLDFNANPNRFNDRNGNPLLREAADWENQNPHQARRATNLLLQRGANNRIQGR
jgi:opacity protein-like surface antigen